tara:strand:- start:5 stop:430 length:426 start_codon:yes stop_codon:yes gene_type:complete
MPTADNQLTGLEKGLLNIKSNQTMTINQQSRTLDKRTKFIIDLLKDDHTKLKEFYIIGDFWIKGFRMTEIKEYTNKKGVKSMKHYVGNKYISPQPKNTEPVLVGGWCINIDEKTIDLYDIDGEGNLIANKERFNRYYINMD